MTQKWKRSQRVLSTNAIAVGDKTSVKIVMAGFDIRSIDQLIRDGKISSDELKSRAGTVTPESFANSEWRKAQQLGDSYWLYVWGCKTNPQLLMIQTQPESLWVMPRKLNR